MTAGENILLNHEPRSRWGLIDTRRLYREAQDIFSSLGIDMDAHVVVSTLGAALQQAVELAKALFLKANIVIMDEPTAALGEAEIQRLFTMVRRLRDQGTSVIYISHHLEEVFRIADRVTVLRDGCQKGTFAIAEVTEGRLVALMVGREIANVCVDRSSVRQEQILRCENLSAPGLLHDVTLTVHRGEILGVAGMVGSGRTELARLLFGALQPSSGRIIFKGREVRGQTPARSIGNGMGLVPEERKYDGLVLGMDVSKNITLAGLRQFRVAGFLNLRREREAALRFMQRLSINATGPRSRYSF